MPFDLGLWQTLWMAGAILGAAFVRGYSGFGFAALIVSAAGIVTDPLPFVPVVILADMVLTIVQAQGIRHDIDWRRVGLLFAGCLPGVPLGVWALTTISADTARALISGYVLAMCGVLLAGLHLRRAAGSLPHLLTGVLSGVANGAGVGGLPVAAFFAAQPIAAATFRATLVAYFTLLDLWTLPVMGANGLLSGATLHATLVFLPLMVLGVWAGSRHFLRAEPQGFRRFAIALLAVLATLGLLRSLA